MASDSKATLSSWKLDLESIIPDRKSQIDPPGYDATIAKDPVRVLPLVTELQPAAHAVGSYPF